MQSIKTRITGAGSASCNGKLYRVPLVSFKDDDGSLARQVKDALARGEVVIVRKPQVTAPVHRS